MHFSCQLGGLVWVHLGTYTRPGEPKPARGPARPWASQPCRLTGLLPDPVDTTRLAHARVGHPAGAVPTTGARELDAAGRCAAR